MNGAYRKAHRPSSFAPQREDEFEQDRRRTRESRIERYAGRAHVRLPLFHDPPAKKSA